MTERTCEGDGIMFISKSEHFKLIQAIRQDLIDPDDANYQAFSELDQEDKDLIDKADRNDDSWSPIELQIEWDSSHGRDDQVSLVVHTGVSKSEIEEAEGNTDSELYNTLNRYGEKWAEKELEMMEDKIEEKHEDLVDETSLAEREAELYVLTEELGYNVPQASELMDISKNNAYGKRGVIKEKIQEAEKTAELEL